MASDPAFPVLRGVGGGKRRCCRPLSPASSAPRRLWDPSCVRPAVGAVCSARVGSVHPPPRWKAAFLDEITIPRMLGEFQGSASPCRRGVVQTCLKSRVFDVSPARGRCPAVPCQGNGSPASLPAPAWLWRPVQLWAGRFSRDSLQSETGKRLI